MNKEFNGIVAIGLATLLMDSVLTVEEDDEWRLRSFINGAVKICEDSGIEELEEVAIEFLEGKIPIKSFFGEIINKLSIDSHIMRDLIGQANCFHRNCNVDWLLSIMRGTNNIFKDSEEEKNWGENQNIPTNE